MRFKGFEEFDNLTERPGDNLKRLVINLGDPFVAALQTLTNLLLLCLARHPSYQYNRAGLFLN